MLRLDWSLLFNMINLIVLYLLMSRFLIKPITSIMEQRQAVIRQQFAGASDAETKAEELKRQYEEKMKISQVESAKMVEQARQEARQEYNRIVKDAGGQADRILSDARSLVDAERQKTLRDVESEIAGLALAAASKVIGAAGNHESNQLLYQQFLAKAGDSNDTNLG